MKCSKILIALIGLGFGANVAFSQTSDLSLPHKAGSASVTEFSNERWLIDPWTGNDKPYKAVRNAIDQAFAKRRITPGTIESYRSRADKRPTDPVAQFRWAYTSYTAAQQYPPVPQKIIVGLYPLENVKFPGSYEFARLCFLVGTRFPNSRLEPFGERLLKRNPKDYEVQYRTLRSFDPTVSPAAKQKALFFLHNLMQLKPNDPSSFGEIGNVYYYIWSRGHDPEAKQRALEGYNQYLKYPQIGQDQRRTTEFIIDTIKRG